MAETTLFLDLTEILANPLRTGIQRVEREIIRHWPGPARLAPCRYDAARGGFVTVSDRVLEILAEATGSPAAELERLKPLSVPLQPISVTRLARGLFNPEVFYDPCRAAAYREICRVSSARISWLVFDFLPFLRPQDYAVGTPQTCMPYLRALRDVPRVGFISALTQKQYTTQIMRSAQRTGPYFPLGGDALSMEAQEFSLEKTAFAYIGTIEPRKNVALILEAFERLWAAGLQSELVVIGRLDSRSTAERPILKRLEAEPRFKYLGHADDATVRDTLRRVRATLFVSAVEGFGIPPYESLSAGIPAIVSPGLPSMDLLPAGGRITLTEVTAQTVEGAIRELLDDRRAAELWSEAARMVVPTWKDFTFNIASWLEAA
jgi:glycosyltransferase involved in cell wall biosynthesis